MEYIIGAILFVLVATGYIIAIKKEK